METNRPTSGQPWVQSKIALMILIRSGSLVCRIGNALFILEERSNNLHSKMVPSANQRMCGLAEELRSDSRTKSKIQTPDLSKWVICKCVSVYCIPHIDADADFNSPAPICSENSIIWKEKCIVKNKVTFIRLYLQFKKQLFLCCLPFLLKVCLANHLCVVYLVDVVFIWPEKTLFGCSFAVRSLFLCLL